MNRRWSIRSHTFSAVAAACATVLILTLAPAAGASTTHDDPRLRTGFSETVEIPPDGAVPQATEPEPRLETFDTERPVAPGVTLTSFEAYGPDAYTGTPTWLQADLLTTDLTGGVEVDYLFPGRVSEREPLSVQADRAEAVAAVNGDFFDINASGAPQGVAVRNGEVIQSPIAGDHRASAAIFTPDGLGSIGEVFFEGTITLPTGETPALDAINKPALGVDEIAAFTPLWGSYCRCRAVEDAAETQEVVVTDGVVTEIVEEAREGEIADDAFVLVGREDGAATLSELAVGDAVGIEYDARAAEDQEIHAALNGRQLLVVDGEVRRAAESHNTPGAPRTAIGFSADGARMYLLSVDGRQPSFAEGVGLDELGAMMVEAGAHTALNLDGGGSTTMVARTPGADRVRVENRPSDGEERTVPNGLGLFAPEGSGRLDGFWVETLLAAERVDGPAYVPPARPDRVFPGLTRTLTAAGHDETYAPVEADPHWRSDDQRVGTMDREGVFTAHATGTATVTAGRRSATGDTALTVLGELTRIETTPERVGLADSEASTVIEVVGHDAHGFAAPVEAADVELTIDETVARAEVTEDGRFEIRATTDSGATLATLRVADVETTLAVTVGLEELVVADFEDAADWTYFGERADGDVAVTEGRDGDAVRLTYDFTASTGTRTGGALPPGGEREIPGQPQELRARVHSEGNGEWASLQVWDGAGQLLPALRAGHLDEPGWRELVFDVPPGTRYPLSLRRVYFAETEPDASYHGEVIVDELTAMVPPPVDVPPARPVVDPVVASGASVAGRDWRFAVVSDAQFVARDPDSEIVAYTRRALREIRAGDAEFLIINGDFVDEAEPEDFALARRILDEELEGELPYYYVPGNHEVSEGTLAHFREAFGDTQRVVDHHGTRFILLDTARFSYKAGDWSQLPLLREELDRAAEDPTVTSVVVAQHVPFRDPLPSKASELSDRKEAATVEGWLADFQTGSGKGAAFIGAHVGVFHADRVDGVPYVINGNVGKNPSAGPTDGGFTGWSLWGVDTDGAPEDWVSTELRPHVDGLEVDAPTSVEVGAQVDVTATVDNDGVAVPVAYPVSADWSGSDDVHIGPAEEAEADHVAAFDPTSGRFSALGEGTVDLGVTVNGVTEQVTITLTS
ncbi:phosphodiester glycosidase family protein [Nocardiopsis sp. MG754419]|uniref:phosphodiester glycosidase family protein n=1 Tax=Nocardiopsis sp. MG754419 TaxID=2259865 RepID=UPI001BA6CA7D|nr:phosphodiester glycosidase family protein [Nocardiopsis sp. MG754419]MBR8741210.1 multidrug transporter [Nocardiopsis sp. MG754419]